MVTNDKQDQSRKIEPSAQANTLECFRITTEETRLAMDAVAKAIPAKITEENQTPSAESIDRQGFRVHPKGVSNTFFVEFKEEFIEELSKAFSREDVSVIASVLDRTLAKFNKQIVDHFLDFKESKRVNELGLEMLPLEAEVDELTNKAKNEETILPDYRNRKFGGQYDNPIDFVRRELGKYINQFNGGKGTYLYLDQLRKLDSKFYPIYSAYISKNPKWKNLIPPKSVRLDKQAEMLRQYPELKGKVQRGRGATLLDPRRA